MPDGADPGSEKRNERHHEHGGDRQRRLQGAAPEQLARAACEQGAERQRDELRGGAKPREESPVQGRGDGEQRVDAEQRHERVVGVAREREERVRICRPGIREHDPQLPPGRARSQPAPEQEQPQQREQVERDRRRVRRRQVVPRSAPWPDALERDVGEVVDRPVGVRVRVDDAAVLVEREAVLDAVGADRASPGDIAQMAAGHV